VAPAFEIYRFDDHLETGAVISAPNVSSAARVADPIIYRDFSGDVTWRLLRGRMGALKGELVVKGDGGRRSSSPQRSPWSTGAFSKLF